MQLSESMIRVHHVFHVSVEKVFAESRSINRARVDSHVARSDFRVSSAAYPRILGARGADAAKVPRTFRYGVSFCCR
jgi:hypothetical protein